MRLRYLGHFIWKMLEKFCFRIPNVAYILVSCAPSLFIYRSGGTMACLFLSGMGKITLKSHSEKQNRKTPF